MHGRGCLPRLPLADTETLAGIWGRDHAAGAQAVAEGERVALVVNRRLAGAIQAPDPDTESADLRHDRRHFDSESGLSTLGARESVSLD
jgi:hypothetical protein